jgi:hypothetical protein
MSKRSLTREKYSPLRGGGIREPSPISSGRSMSCSTVSLSSSGAGQTGTASAMPSIKTSAARSPGTYSLCIATQMRRDKRPPIENGKWD